MIQSANGFKHCSLFQSASALASGRSSKPLRLHGTTFVSIRVRPRERTIRTVQTLETFTSSFNPRPPSRADDFVSPSLGANVLTFQSASALASGRFRADVQRLGCNQFQSASALASGRSGSVEKIQVLRRFNPRPPSRADDFLGRFPDDSQYLVSIRVRPRERTI